MNIRRIFLQIDKFYLVHRKKKSTDLNERFALIIRPHIRVTYFQKLELRDQKKPIDLDLGAPQFLPFKLIFSLPERKEEGCT